MVRVLNAKSPLHIRNGSKDIASAKKKKKNARQDRSDDRIGINHYVPSTSSKLGALYVSGTYECAETYDSIYGSMVLCRIMILYRNGALSFLPFFYLKICNLLFTRFLTSMGRGLFPQCRLMNFRTKSTGTHQETETSVAQQLRASTLNYLVYHRCEFGPRSGHQGEREVLLTVGQVSSGFARATSEKDKVCLRNFSCFSSGYIGIRSLSMNDITKIF